MVFVFTYHGEAGTAAFTPTIELSAVIPAPRLLTEVATYGALVSKLWARHDACRLGQARQQFTDSWVSRNFSDTCHRSDAQSAVSRPVDTLELR